MDILQHYNLAPLENVWRNVYIGEDKTCVFLSHKKEDEQAAVAIGNFLMETVGAHIYLDTRDCELKEAVSIENDQKIVDSVNSPCWAKYQKTKAY